MNGTRTATKMSERMVDRLGGRVRVVQIVSDFYRRVLESPVLADFFRDASMETLIVHQSEFLAAILDASPTYSDQELQAVHSTMVITGPEFDEMLALLRASLNDHSIGQDDGEVVVSAFARRRPFIVNSA
jgi:truncated hemoglobin YjbI